MRLVVFVIGTLAAALGIVSTLFAFMLESVAWISGESQLLRASFFAALGMSVIGFLGARLARAHPRLSSALMVPAAVGGVASITWFYLIAALLFMIASTLSFLWRNDYLPGA